MGQNLRDRLRRIKETETTRAATQGYSLDKTIRSAEMGDQGSIPGWVPAGFQTLTRSVILDRSLVLPVSLPRSLPILIPDLFSYRVRNSPLESGSLESDFLKPDDLLFFDLETTGLSGGAGTVAFLAAFGRLVNTGKSHEEHWLKPYQLKIDQYLLLDYPGESDFLEALLQELQPGTSPEGAGTPPLIVVTYNGKCFDAQILKNRCLMNGISPPRYYHADLLHPARCLWKRRLSTCSQGEIETAILGLDRTGDVPGAHAPEIWFSFLNTGATEALLRVCDHNQRDILGLASIFTALAHIAEAPIKGVEQFHGDLENLALHWREALRQPVWEEAIQETGRTLLEVAVAREYPKAALVMGLDMMRQDHYEAGRSRLLQLIRMAHEACPDNLKAIAYRALAIDAEWHIRDRDAALAYVDAGLNLQEVREGMKRELCYRRDRLVRKNNPCTSA
ncbi:MAG: ribonuclease H-like domain-containing protein [Treponema sp.]|jgi:uncharacterized protein YprB with RNaseH-like and TPR domain|nr:ribonuclease H-like domain-containing protein [Treponema sp.]